MKQIYLSEEHILNVETYEKKVEELLNGNWYSLNSEEKSEILNELSDFISKTKFHLLDLNLSRYLQESAGRMKVAQSLRKELLDLDYLYEDILTLSSVIQDCISKLYGVCEDNTIELTPMKFTFRHVHYSTVFEVSNFQKEAKRLIEDGILDLDKKEREKISFECIRLVSEVRPLISSYANKYTTDKTKVYENYHIYLEKTLREVSEMYSPVTSLKSRIEIAKNKLL